MKYVYLIKDDVSGLTKIGISANPKERLSALKGSENRLAMLKWFIAELDDERAMHFLFAEKRRNGEWFDLNFFDIKAIEAYFENKIACAKILRQWAIKKPAITRIVKDVKLQNKMPNPKQTKYKFIGAFAFEIKITRSGVYKALEANDEQVWGKYAAFLEERNRRQLTALEEAKARVSNARKLFKSEIAALVAAQ